MKTNQWYVAKMNNIADQGLVVDEGTGENIAVTYKKENARLISAAPELLEALEHAVNWMIGYSEKAGIDMPEWVKQGKTAIAKAEGRTEG